MKTKDDILHMLKVMEFSPDINTTAEHQRAELLIEVLIDIRDILNELLIAHKLISGGVGR